MMVGLLLCFLIFPSIVFMLVIGSVLWLRQQEAILLLVSFYFLFSHDTQVDCSGH